ncbi:MAG: transposase [Armatimonadetes bacterium]|nr:transposase [Armatimonadota bacterium]
MYESFFEKLRDELLSFKVFHRRDNLQLAFPEFQDHYNNHRPHLALGGLTPAAYKVSLTTNKRKGGNPTTLHWAGNGNYQYHAISLCPA